MIKKDESIEKTYFVFLFSWKLLCSKIAEQLSDKLLQSKIDNFQKLLIDDVWSNVPNTFWHRRKHIVDLLYVRDIINLSYIKDFPTNVS